MSRGNGRIYRQFLPVASVRSCLSVRLRAFVPRLSARPGRRRRQAFSSALEVGPSLSGRAWSFIAAGLIEGHVGSGAWRGGRRRPGGARRDRRRAEQLSISPSSAGSPRRGRCQRFAAWRRRARRGRSRAEHASLVTRSGHRLIHVRAMKDQAQPAIWEGQPRAARLGVGNCPVSGSGRVTVDVSAIRSPCRESDSRRAAIRSRGRG